MKQKGGTFLPDGRYISKSEVRNAEDGFAWDKKTMNRLAEVPDGSLSVASHAGCECELCKLTSHCRKLSEQHELLRAEFAVQWENAKNLSKGVDLAREAWEVAYCKVQAALKSASKAE